MSKTIAETTVCFSLYKDNESKLRQKRSRSLNKMRITLTLAILVICIKTGICFLLFPNHSFVPDISIAPLHVHYYSEALTTTADTSSELTHRSATDNCE